MELDPVALQEIESSIGEQIAALQGLNDALDAELEALRAASADRLDAATTAKSGWLERVESGGSALLECAARHGHDGRERLDTWLERADPCAAQPRAMLARLQSTTRDCIERNQRNGAVIEGANRQVSDALSVLHDGGGRTGSTYDAAGGRNAPGRIHLGSA